MHFIVLPENCNFHFFGLTQKSKVLQDKLKETKVQYNYRIILRIMLQTNFVNYVNLIMHLNEMHIQNKF